MRINNNLMAMNTHRQLGINSNNGAKSIEKLSSGYRINRAGDDAAGLAISEKMRSQVRGLNQASRNGQDGISLIQTAEGALNESQAILQRMRELAVQSANDTNVNTDRTAIQNEIDQLGQEINRIATTTEFNTQALLKGDGKSNLTGTHLDLDTLTSTVQTGANSSTKEIKATINLIDSTTQAVNHLVTGNDLKVSLNGRELTVTFGNAGGTAVAGDTTISGSTATIDLGGASLTAGANDTAVTKATSDALQALIDANSDLKGNYKVAVSGGNISIEAVTGGDFEGSKGNIKITSSAHADAVVSTAGPSGSLVAYTEGTTGTVTGQDIPATATIKDIDFSSIAAAADVEKLIGTGITINDQQIEFYNADRGVYEGDAIGVDISDATNGATVIDAIVTQTAGKLTGVTLGEDTTTPTTTDLRITSTETGSSSEVSVSNGGVQKEFKATFQIGANELQTMEVSIGDMRSSALGIEGVDISTSTAAQSAITTIDNALGKVSDERAKLGAFQNRLEHTIKNLDTSSENLQASESRIRDVDMAKEMMNFTKNNILQQAAQAMLAQANQAPQGVLQLLR